MSLLKSKVMLLAIVLILFSYTSIFAAAAEEDMAFKRMDHSAVHDVGNIWLRVSNYGFFGSGNNRPQWPSLEYPGGSGIDYLYQGALWFGAKKIRRDAEGNKLYWTNPANPQSEHDVISEHHPDFDPGFHTRVVVDTLVTVGFDGDASLYEFLPAYNPLETNALGASFVENNLLDRIMTQSIRTQRAGVDDDGDGLIDEDPVGMAFPFRPAHELPEVFADFGGKYMHDFRGQEDLQSTLIQDNIEIWFPLGFMDLAQDPSGGTYLYTQPWDDDGDGLDDEDGAPVSELDYIGYYYDYSPFGTPGRRNWGNSAGSFEHHPLNIKVRQMSYQWSYEYIENLVYIEFNITNMNPFDTLYDCAMGIYMDCDVGPQAFDPDERSMDDVSGYVAGENFEFAYSRDYDGDGGLTTGWIGARVCTPDPEQLEFACWNWTRGNGPDDRRPRRPQPPAGQVTSNEKYWLLTGRNPNPEKFQALRPEGWEPGMNPWYEESDPNDTRFLFAFYGDMRGLDSPTDGSWNLAPGRTMKIVIAVFPGENIEDLKRTATFAKNIYGEAQVLETVILPDTFPHYMPPEPPAIPKMHGLIEDDGRRIDVYWDNRSEFTIDHILIDKSIIGWQNINSKLDSYYQNYPGEFTEDEWPEEFRYVPGEYNLAAIVNPWTAYRLRHDFQGYSLYGRSGSGLSRNWQLVEKWDKVDSEVDLHDYGVGYIPGTDFDSDFGGNLGIDKGLPNPKYAEEYDKNYYKLNDYFILEPIEVGDKIYGYPLYNYEVDYSDSLQNYAYELSYEDQALLFAHPDLLGMPEVYLEIFNPAMIPLQGFPGMTAINIDPENALPELRRRRLASRYYKSSIYNPPRGIEYYVAVTAWDRGMPTMNLDSLESGRDADANMKVFFPGPSAKPSMDNIYVVPNPYFGLSNFDGRREGDAKGDRSKRIWFVNLPERATIRIYTLAGDLVDIIEHDGSSPDHLWEDVINVSKAANKGLTGSGMRSWNLLSRYNQVIAPGVYLYSVRDHDSGKNKVNKFVIIQ